MEQIIEIKEIPQDGLRVELFVTLTGRHAWRMYDTDAHELVGIRIYKSAELAKRGFDELVAKMAYYDGPAARV